MCCNDCKSRIQPPIKLAEWQHHVAAIGGALLQPRIPRLHMRDCRPLDLELEIAIERSAGRDIRQAERVAAQKWPVRKEAVQQLEMPRAARDLVADGGQVPLRLGRAVEAPEHA